mmetsp:Transcript_15820/g.21709  ORF Transcript_15820/g.21709 Transcript_15820/m.21709 type:complete len:356 (-) Transcript_15820:15-1082(-)|eukprot:CAMPEP_0185735852 /NCGR_PEP_ID=MMETSP1171-20130828/26272_1 /TAXON_ID=374046 /ORGANISM="Helicotheca tamensis, Strain CCMP826" /LENGTH=355 /DNA_ID=CAMNT_0028406287 /DNA_START=68 /DNA_END=1135 /DNA_ORIENTATION=+
MSSFSKNDKLIAELLRFGISAEAVHEDFGVSLHLNGRIEEVGLGEGWLVPLVEKYGLVIVKGQTHLAEKDASGFVPAVKRILAEPYANRENVGLFENAPEIQVLGSPESPSHPEATFIPAREQESSDSFRAWVEEGVPCAVTDWHSDEPWEGNRTKFTLALCAESTGPNATMFSSTVALYNRTDDATKNMLEGTQTLFVPPHWLPDEEGKKAKHSTVQKSHRLGDSFYICMDAMDTIDGMETLQAKELVWNLTKDCMKPEHVHFHQWEKGDLLFWDNTRTLHARSPYDQTSVDRVLYRMRVTETVVPNNDDKKDAIVVRQQTSGQEDKCSKVTRSCPTVLQSPSVLKAQSWALAG